VNFTGMILMQCVVKIPHLFQKGNGGKICWWICWWWWYSKPIFPYNERKI